MPVHFFDKHKVSPSGKFVAALQSILPVELKAGSFIFLHLLSFQTWSALHFNGLLCDCILFWNPRCESYKVTDYKISWVYFH